MAGYIEFKDVKKVYKMGEVEIEALSGVDFSINKGEFVIVAGASGAGKSTVLNKTVPIIQKELYRFSALCCHAEERFSSLSSCPWIAQ